MKKHTIGVFWMGKSAETKHRYAEIAKRVRLTSRLVRCKVIRLHCPELRSSGALPKYARTFLLGI